MTLKEMRSKKDQDLRTYQQKCSEELAMLKLQASVGQCQNTSKITQLRRDIARIKTIFREKVANGN